MDEVERAARDCRRQIKANNEVTQVIIDQLMRLDQRATRVIRLEIELALLKLDEQTMGLTRLAETYEADLAAEKALRS